MAATDRWIPMWKSAPHDHDGIFRALRSEMVSRFEEVGFLGFVARVREAASDA